MISIPCNLQWKETFQKKNFFWIQYYCQGDRVTTVTTNYAHQIPIPWLLITAPCLHSSRVEAYPCTPPAQSLSGLKHCMFTFLTLTCLWLPATCSCVLFSILHRLHAPSFPLNFLEKDWLLPDKTQETLPFPAVYSSGLFALPVFNKPAVVFTSVFLCVSADNISDFIILKDSFLCCFKISTLIIIRNVSWATYQYIRMISEGHWRLK